MGKASLKLGFLVFLLVAVVCNGLGNPPCKERVDCFEYEHCRGVSYVSCDAGICSCCTVDLKTGKCIFKK
ncbi:hypothetical protein Lalb_Chr03g0032111 [Lupinus albus]|uniref:Uncharacterized protein n=1 Tax=Lupinus albus TaxID=3870 RepID=A0A6A4QV51_LUPAL|nr:hypothetical protein Lalb_Chr03g0032111 [Lupinus albus]